MVSHELVGVEDTIRFIKQSYNVEDIRVLAYQRLKNMAALVSAAAFFIQSLEVLRGG
jgi:hypothetical protein